MHSLALLCAPLSQCTVSGRPAYCVAAGRLNAVRLACQPSIESFPWGCRAPKTRAGGDRDVAKSLMQSLFARFIGQLEEVRPRNCPCTLCMHACCLRRAWGHVAGPHTVAGQLPAALHTHSACFACCGILQCVRNFRKGGEASACKEAGARALSNSLWSKSCSDFNS